MDQPLLQASHEPSAGRGSAPSAGRGAVATAQLRSVLRKNWLLRVRGQPRTGRWSCMTGTAGFVMELCLPMVFIVLCCLPRWLGGGIVSFDASLKPAVRIDDASHSSWRPNVDILSQTPHIFIAPATDEGGADVGELERLGHAAAEAMVCDFVSAVDRSGSKPPEVFSSWILKDIPKATIVACAEDCTNTEYCVRPLMQEAMSVFNSSTEAALAVASIDPRRVSPFLLNFEQFSTQGIDVTIRMNHTDTMITTEEERYFRFFGSPPSEYKQYFSFMNMQSIVSRAGMGVLLADLHEEQEFHPLDLNVHVQPFPWIAYTLDQGALAASVIFSILIVFAFISPSKANTTYLVREKEQRQREGMLLLGLRLETYWLSWFLTFMAMGTISSLGMAIIGMYPFSYSSVSLMFVFYLAISAATVSMSFFFSTFFSSSKVAATLTTLLYVAAMMPASLVQIIYPSGSSLYWLVCLFPPSAVSLFSKALIILETGQRGLTWREGLFFDIFSNPQSPFRAADVLLMLIVDVVLYSVLTFYADAVLPKEFGQRLPVLFPFDAGFWFPEVRRRRERRMLDLTRSPNSSATNLMTLECEEPSSPACRGKGGSVEARMLTKAFDGKIAVDNLCVSLRAGIVSLLGANGAGKTTTISMLTGMLEPTAGDASFFEEQLSLSKDMSTIRRRLSLCPQFDIVFESLSVREHLEIFARFKGLSVRASRAAAMDAARDVDLIEKLDTTAGSLSGGQRRRLSIAMAFLGDPEVVFLDEPTSGLDPQARRFVWDLIRRRRGNGRLIVLTTHFLEEADQLSDRVVILRAGRLVAEGTPLELKQQYGTGYTLSCVLGQGGAVNRDAVMRLVHSHLPGAKLDDAASSDRELRITLPKQPSNDSLISLLEELEQEAYGELGINGFGLSCSSLEDVFLRVGEPNDGKAPKVGRDGDSADGDHAISLPEQAKKAMPAMQKPFIFRQIGALLTKRIRWAIRDKMPILTQILVPVLCIVLANIAGRAGESPPVLPALPLTRENCMMGQRASLAIGDGIDGADSFAGEVLQAIRSSAGYTDSGTNRTTNRIDDESINGTLPGFLLDNWYTSLKFDALLIHSSAGTTSLNYTVMGNETAFHSTPAALAEADSAVFKSIFGSETDGISVTNHPLPFSQDEKIAKANALAENILLIVCAGIALSILSSSFAVFLVKERRCGALQLHRLSGVSHAVYWVSNLAFDTVTACVPLAAIILVFFAFDLPQFMGRGALAVLLLLLSFVISALPLTYLVQRLYTDEIKALVSLSGTLFLLTFVTSITAMVIQVLAASDLGSTRAIYRVIKWAFRILPHYCCCMGLFNLSMNHIGLLSLVVEPYSFRVLDPLSLEVTGYHIIFMAAESLVLLLLVFIIDVVPVGEWWRSFWTHRQRAVVAKASVEADTAADASVLAEKEKTLQILDGGAGSEYPLIVDRLCHVYGDGTVAVKSVSFAVGRGEIFGLLGVNGAGKTSTFKSIVGDLTPTAGNVSCDRQRTGYCPQFDATLSLLTPMEHFRLYARLRGSTAMEAEALAHEFLERIDLVKNKDTPAYALSGGNRRKLSVGISLISAPDLICLDEPSTGMSSGAKRKLWALLSEERRGRSIVLTSHSMVECEALCTRLCIMKGGIMMCLGSVQGLKTAYGAGYVAIFRLSSSSAVGDLTAFVKEIMPDAIAGETAGEVVKFVLPTVGNGTVLSAVFRAIEAELDAEENGRGRVSRIHSYSLSQCTLEDVFLALAGS